MVALEPYSTPVTGTGGTAVESPLKRDLVGPLSLRSLALLAHMPHGSRSVAGGLDAGTEPKRPPIAKSRCCAVSHGSRLIGAPITCVKPISKAQTLTVTELLVTTE